MVPGKVLQNSVSFRFVQELRKVIVNEFSFEMFYSSYFLFVFPNNDFERTQTRRGSMTSIHHKILYYWMQNVWWVKLFKKIKTFAAADNHETFCEAL